MQFQYSKIQFMAHSLELSTRRLEEFATKRCKKQMVAGTDWKTSSSLILVNMRLKIELNES